MTADVGVALRHGVERVAGAGVLLDDIPLGAGLIRGLDDGLPSQVAVADLHDRAVVVGRADAVVFEVEQRQPAMQAADPFDRAFATGSHPVGVDLALEVGGVGQVVQMLEHRLAGDLLELDGVIMVGQNLPGLAHEGTRDIKLDGQRLDVIERLQFDMRVRIGGVRSAQLGQTVDDLGGLLDDDLAVLMGGADDEAFAVADALDFGFGNRAHAGDLHCRIADGLDLFGGRGEVGGGFAEIAQGVELAGDLGEEHGGWFRDG